MLKYPITGIAGCCARAASGQAAAAPPMRVTNSRRFMFLIEIGRCASRASGQKDSTPRYGRRLLRCEILTRLNAVQQNSHLTMPLPNNWECDRGAKVFLSLHFLFQDLTQYQERYWPNTEPRERDRN